MPKVTGRRIDVNDDIHDFHERAYLAEHRKSTWRCSLQKSLIGGAARVACRRKFRSSVACISSFLLAPLSSVSPLSHHRRGDAPCTTVHIDLLSIVCHVDSHALLGLCRVPPTNRAVCGEGVLCRGGVVYARLLPDSLDAACAACCRSLWASEPNCPFPWQKEQIPES